jgi:hypothetical protein
MEWPCEIRLQSLAYRLEWNQSRALELKAAIIAYNTDDCTAVETVTSRLSAIIRDAKSRVDVEFSNRPKRVASDKGVEIHGSIESLLKSAHFINARSGIRLRAAKATQVLPPKEEKATRRRLLRPFSTMKGRIVRVPRRRICPNHPGQKLSVSSKTSQHSLLDLKFSKTGCRKSIVRYTGVMGYCSLCNVYYAAPGTRALRGQLFG